MHLLQEAEPVSQAGAACLSDAPEAEEGVFSDRAASVIQHLFTGLPTPDNKGNQALAPWSEKVCDCFL